MPLNELLIKRVDAVTYITFNRPDKLNAFNKAIFDQLKSLIDVVETDRSTKVLIFTGSGEKAFCVGADLKERQGMNEKDVLLRLEMIRLLYSRMERLPIPTIAAIQGMALGGGLEFAMVCDFRISTESAVLGLPEVDLAIIPGNGGTQRLTRIIGFSKALEMVLLAKKITGKEAKEIGLVHRLAADPLAEAELIAKKLLESGPIAIRQAKSAIREGMELPLSKALQVEIDAYKACLYSKDRLEGLKAFAEKRRPQFRAE